MRKKDKIFLWPVYFDLTKTRLEGRRVPKSLAIPSPKKEEILEAAERVGLQPKIIPDARYPRSPWQKTGLIVIQKKGSKTQILRKVVKQLLYTHKK